VCEKDLEFYSQFGEDQWIFNNIKLPKNGVFVDVGAGDPSHISNSYFFEKIGWQVYCIDGDYRQILKLMPERKNVIHAVVSDKSHVYFKQRKLDLSMIVATKEDQTELVATKTLNQILIDNKIKKIDILSVDVEGSELSVLRSFNIDKYYPKVIIVEYNTLGKKQDKKIISFLGKQYIEATRLGANLIMVRRENKLYKVKKGEK
jgi:FkbM family methyltransferase